MKKLKRCPFCGAKPILFQRKNKMLAIVCPELSCFAWACNDKNCKGCTDGYVNKNYAIDCWNRRV